MSKGKGKFFLGALFGAVAGAVAGVVMAPKSGEETRKDIKDEAEKVGDKVQETGKKWFNVGKKKVESIEGKAEKAVKTVEKDAEKKVKDIKTKAEKAEKLAEKTAKEAKKIVKYLANKNTPARGVFVDLTFLKSAVVILAITGFTSSTPSKKQVTKYTIALPPTMTQNFGKTAKNEISVARSGINLVRIYETMPVKTEAKRIFPIAIQKVLLSSSWFISRFSTMSNTTTSKSALIDIAWARPSGPKFR